MRDEHLTPVLEACSQAELALLIEFLGRPPSGLLWLDRRIRDGRHSHSERVAAVVEEVLRCGDHSVKGRLGGGKVSWVQVVCDALNELELSEAPTADGIAGLEMRVVRYVLDSEFDRLEPAVQEALLAHFTAGDFFVDGLHGYDALNPFLTHTDAEHRAFEGGKFARTLKHVGGQALRRRVRTFATKKLLRFFVRRLAGPVQWVITVWDWLGPAYRLTVPAICYVAYLRHTQRQRAAQVNDQARAAS